MNSNTVKPMILEILEKSQEPSSPKELIDSVNQIAQQIARIGDTPILEAVWRLIDQGKVSLTRDWKFQRVT